MVKRINWLAILRGFTILLVVMYHVQLIDKTTGECHALCNAISHPFDYLRMPVFIFSSGFLLYVTRISRRVGVSDLYKEKFERIVIPFIFFGIVYYAIKMLFSSFVKTQVEASFTDFLLSYVFFSNSPIAHLWYLATLFSLMLLYPLFVYVFKSNVRILLFGIISVVIYFFDFSILEDYNYFNILYLNKYIVFFYVGMVVVHYKLYDYLQGYIKTILLLALYVVSFLLEIRLLAGISGIFLFISLFMLIDRYVPKLFSSYRNYIYQIYLMSFIFQPFVELILWKTLFYNENLLMLFYVINVAFGIYGPVLVSKLIERVPYRMVRLCFGLK